MLGRLILYYSLFLPASLVLVFCPIGVQILFLLFLILVTAALPYSKKFIINSLKRLPSFIVLSILIVFGFSLMADFIEFLVLRIHPHLILLWFIPIYVGFRLLTLPWIFINEGFEAPLICFKINSAINWRIVSILIILWFISMIFPYAPFFLFVPISFLIKNFIISAQKVNKTPVLD